MTLRALKNRLRRMAQVSNRERRLLAEAVAWLALVRSALLVVPFPALARRLGAFVRPDDPRVLPARYAAAADHVRIARDIGWAVTRAARYVPFKAVCLPQAIAARCMLKRRGVGSVLHFGTAKDDDKPLEAHAWLDAAGVEVTGYPVEARFAELACLVE